MVVLNNPEQEGAGFDTDTNVVSLFHKNGKSKQLEILPKLDAAHQIFQFLLDNP